MIVDGKALAGEILSALKPKLAALLHKRFFGAVLVGDDPASVSFLKQKEKAARELGIDFRLYRVPETISTDDLRREIGRLAGPKACGGFIVQLPLPSSLNRQYVLNAIPKEKDVDVLGEAALGAVYAGRGAVAPPAAGAVEAILQSLHYDVREKTAAVVGAGFLIGRPIATWLMGQARKVCIFDKGADLAGLREADLVVTGVGKIGLVTPERLKDGAGVIDFGYAKGEDDKLRGDFDASGLDPDDRRVAFYTPTPGGTGPILVAELFENFYKLNS